MTYRLRNIVLAVGLAALAALLTSFYVANYKKTVQQDEASVTVYVAAKQIPAGTPGADVLSQNFLRPEKVARRLVVPGAVSQPSQIRELIATETVYEGDQISVRRFKPVEAAGIRAELHGNLRAMQVNGDPHQLLAGTLKKGDHVDLVGAFKGADERDGDRAKSGISRVVLRNLLVLRAPDGPGEGSKLAAGDGDSTVQLAMTDAQAQKFEFTRRAEETSGWSLLLRPVNDDTDSAERLDTLQTILCDGMRPGAPQCSRR